jgi:hypothetical protein
MAEEVKYKGVPFFMNGRDYIIPSLSLKQVEENYAHIAGAATAFEGSVEDSAKTIVDTFKGYVPIIGKAIRRNYPDVTDENLWEWLDIGNFSEVLVIVQSQSGFKTAKTGEALPAK